jgi:protein-tyrosine phosphatase
LIDLHSHILPGIDDGANILADSLAMAHQSIDAGVTHMMCTPHIMQGIYENTQQSIQVAYAALKQAVEEDGCGLKLSYAAEVRIAPEILQWVSDKKIPYLGQWKGKYVILLELPHSHIPAGTDNLLRWLLKHNVQPVIAHPERNRDIIAQYNKINMLRREGCLFQVTAGSFTGRFSEAIKSIALKMLEDDMISYIASDTHNISRRPNDMGEARLVLESEVGEQRALDLVFNTPLKITQDCLWR